MLSSMTGFARETTQANWGILTWEIKSVNHRYCDISLRLPESFRSLEQVCRLALSGALKRGKIDATLKFQPGEQLPFDLHLNDALLAQLVSVSQSIQSQFPAATTSVTDMLSWQGMLRTEETGMDVVHEAAVTLLQSTTAKLVTVRQEEGNGLSTFFQERITALMAEAETVEAAMPGVIDAANQRVKERFAELQMECEPDRFEQEMVWLSQKVDIAEELKRLKLHVTAIDKCLQKGGVVGRRLDFLMQELNREANTLASKSIDANVTHAAVEMKVLIEQMREQVQNIE